MICCICKKEFHGFGNNPSGACWKKNGSLEFLSFGPLEKCCDSCNITYVIPGRQYRLILEEKEHEAQKS